MSEWEQLAREADEKRERGESTGPYLLPPLSLRDVLMNLQYHSQARHHRQFLVSLSGPTSQKSTLKKCTDGSRDDLLLSAWCWICSNSDTPGSKFFASLLASYLIGFLLDFSGLSSHFCKSIQLLPPNSGPGCKILFRLLCEKRTVRSPNLHKWRPTIPQSTFSLVQKQYPTSSTNGLFRMKSLVCNFPSACLQMESRALTHCSLQDIPRIPHQSSKIGNR
jgi:hypothetical protein